jgi:cytochrome P450
MSLPAIPSPPGGLLTGHLKPARERPLQYVLEITRDYGDVVQLRLGPSRLIVVNHPDHVKRVLQEKASHYGRPAFVALLRKVVGNGLLFAEGESWLRQRRLMQPSFHRDQITGYAKIMADAVTARIQRWRAAATEPIDFAREAFELVYRSVGPTLFGDAATRDSEALSDAVAVTLRWLNRRTQNPFAPPLFIPTEENRQFRAARQLFSDTVQALIAARRARPSSGAELLSVLIAARDADSGEGMSDAQLQDEVLTFLIAGLETTSVALTWTFQLLAQHPEVLERVRAEQLAVCGTEPPRPDQLERMPYSRMVIDESLRLYPPAFGLTRRALQQDTLGGHVIPAGAQLLVSSYALHRHPKLWSAPDRFAPELHFAPEHAAQRSRFAYIPFGAGPRQCIGQAFARMELQILVPALAAAFDFDLVGEPVQPEATMTLRPAGPVLMRVRPVAQR